MNDLSGLRTIPSESLDNLNKVWNNSYPMLEDWVKVMVKKGVYEVIDSTGKRLPTEQALELIK